MLTQNEQVVSTATGVQVNYTELRVGAGMVVTGSMKNRKWFGYKIRLLIGYALIAVGLVLGLFSRELGIYNIPDPIYVAGLIISLLIIIYISLWRCPGCRTYSHGFFAFRKTCKQCGIKKFEKI